MLGGLPWVERMSIRGQCTFLCNSLKYYLLGLAFLASPNQWCFCNLIALCQNLYYSVFMATYLFASFQLISVINYYYYFVSLLAITLSWELNKCFLSE